MAKMTCGLGLAKCFKICVFIDLGIATVLTVFMTVLLSFVLITTYDYDRPSSLVDKKAEVSGDENSGLAFIEGFIGVAMCIVLFAWVFEVYLFKLARRGIRMKNYSELRKWFLIRIVLLVLILPYSLYVISMRGDTLNICVFMTVFLFQMYKLVVASAFTKTLEPKQTSTPSAPPNVV